MTNRFDKLNLSQMSPTRRGMRSSELKTVSPAQGTGTALALRAVERVALENQIGSHRPSKFVTALSPDKTRLYFLPVVASDDPDALPIEYNASGFHINLYRIFKALDRLVADGIREVYDWEVASEPIEISGVIGKALYITLGTPKKETVKQMPPEVLAKRRATIARKKKAAQNQPTSDAG